MDLCFDRFQLRDFGVLSLLIRLWRLPLLVFCGIRRWLFCTLHLLFLLVLASHGILHDLNRFFLKGMPFRKALLYALPQFAERDFGVWILIGHSQVTSALAVSKQRPIFILTLS